MLTKALAVNLFWGPGLRKTITLIILRRFSFSFSSYLFLSLASFSFFFDFSSAVLASFVIAFEDGIRCDLFWSESSDNPESYSFIP